MALPLVDNRLAYAFFAAAYFFGHGASTLLLATPDVHLFASWLPLIALGIGFAAGTVASIVAAVRWQRSMSGAALMSAQLLGMAWITGFLGLFLAISGLAQSTGNGGLQVLLWPTGSALVVGLVYVAEGAQRRDVLHYALGTWLVVLGGVALLFPAPITLALMAVGGTVAYLVAIFLDSRRRRFPRISAPEGHHDDTQR